MSLRSASTLSSYYNSDPTNLPIVLGTSSNIPDASLSYDIYRTSSASYPGPLLTLSYTVPLTTLPSIQPPYVPEKTWTPNLSRFTWDVSYSDEWSDWSAKTVPFNTRGGPWPTSYASSGIAKGSTQDWPTTSA